MNKNIIVYTVIIFLSMLTYSCGHNEEGHNHDHEESSEHNDDHEGEIHLSNEQLSSMSLKVDTIPLKNISSYVQANGQLEVPPQNMAEVTAVIGANVTNIEVIEGDKVNKGDVLAYMKHPDLIRIQTDYVSNWNSLQYTEKEFLRQKKLYKEKVGSGRELDKIQAEYRTLKAVVHGQEVQLQQLNLNLGRIQKSEIYKRVPIVSPINGHVQHVEVKIGQYVQPQTEMFEIVNIDHIHADLMVFESDMHKVKKGQKVIFSVQALPGQELEAEIHSIGKSFEEGPKAVHIHAEIESNKGSLIPGMYINGQIQVTDSKSLALPEGAIVREGDKHFLFIAKKEGGKWSFRPREVVIGEVDNGWVELKFIESPEETILVAHSSAYYLMAEMKKGEAEHSH